MSERSRLISRLINQRTTRESYIRSKLSVLVPSQIRALRQRREMTQSQLASEAEMKQARVSALERVGDASFSIETLVRIAAAFRVGLVVKFVSMSDMLSWENEFAPDRFEVVPVEDDATFRKPTDRLTPKPSALSDGLSKALSGERSEQIPPDAFSPSMNYAHSSVWPDADSALEGFSANSLRLLECDQNSSTIAGAAATTNLYQRGNAA